METAAILAQPGEVEHRLTELGLSVEELHEAIRRGQFARDNCTANHPRCYPGMAAWAEMSSGLRETLSFRGWTTCDLDNIPKAISPDGSMAIVAITGDRATGNSNLTPVTKRPRGEASIRFIMLNLQYDFLQELEPEEKGDPQEVEGRVTWYLLCYRQGDVVRAELSLPVVVNGGGRIELWRERIILPAIDLGQGPAPAVDSGPDVDVPVHRKAG